MAYGSKGQILDASTAAGRNTNSIMQNWVDRGPWLYWDTITTPASGPLAASYSPFSVPIGAQDPLTSTTKTKLQTNMVRGNQFPPPRCLLLSAIGFYFSSDWLKDDIDKVLKNCYMEFRIDEKIFHEGFLWMFPAGAGLTGVTAVSGQSVYTLGVPAPGYMRRYGDWSKYIAPLQQFSMTIIFPGTPPTLTGASQILIPFLDGLTDRSVQ